MKLYLLFLFLLSSASVGAQNLRADSLVAILGKLKEDSIRVNTLNEIASIYYRTDPGQAIIYGTYAKNLAEELKFQSGLALAYKNIGLGHYMQGNFVEALKNWEPSLEIYRSLGDEQLISNLVGNVGSVYYTVGKNAEAIESYLEALKIAEKLGDSIRIATLLLNIGSVYSEQPATLDTARSYYYKALSMGESIQYMDLLGVGSINLGEVYFKQELYDSALFYFEKSLLFVSSNIDLSAALNYIGRIYTQKVDYPAAIKYHEDALELAESENAQLETVRVLLGLAYCYRKQGLVPKAIDYYNQAQAIAEEIELNYELSDAYEGLAFSYGVLGNYQNAYKFLSLQNLTDNTIYKIETEKKTNNQMFSYQLEKKEESIHILEQKAEIEHLKSRRQKGISIAAGSIGVLLLILVVGFYQRMKFIRNTKDKMKVQRDQIESQRDQIQMQHDMVFSQKKLMTDSISYAERIQSAILPSDSRLKELLNEHFVFFKPKDIVSGDFYWIKEVQDHLIIVGADCTGHGVPGAFMSMLGITMLNDLIGDKCFDAPGAVLEQLRIKIKEMLVQEGNVEDQKDGMDMVIAILDTKTRMLHFAGANNPLYVIRSKALLNENHMDPYFATENDDYQLFELKGDKQPIGVHWEETRFTNHTITLQEEDTFYIFSDGFVDQFGGEKRKKFKSVNFKKLLLSIQKEPMVKQGELLEQTYETWRGSHEQIDDVSVFGVRV